MAVTDKGTSEDVFVALDAALLAATGKVVDRSGDEVESARLEAKSAFASLLDAVRRLPDGLAVDACPTAWPSTSARTTNSNWRPSGCWQWPGWPDLQVTLLLTDVALGTQCPLVVASN